MHTWTWMTMTSFRFRTTFYAMFSTVGCFLDNCSCCCMASSTTCFCALRPALPFRPFTINWRKSFWITINIHTSQVFDSIFFVFDNALLRITSVLHNWYSYSTCLSFWLLPGHGSSLQASLRIKPPSHVPSLFASCNIVLCVILIPPLQEWVQTDHSPHSFQMQFSVWIKMNRNLQH